jgi:hypothetical protein
MHVIYRYLRRNRKRTGKNGILHATNILKKYIISAFLR